MVFTTLIYCILTNKPLCMQTVGLQRIASKNLTIC